MNVVEGDYDLSSNGNNVRSFDVGRLKNGKLDFWIFAILDFLDFFLFSFFVFGFFTLWILHFDN